MRLDEYRTVFLQLTFSFGVNVFSHTKNTFTVRNSFISSEKFPTPFTSFVVPLVRNECHYDPIKHSKLTECS